MNRRTGCAQAEQRRLQLRIAASLAHCCLTRRPRARRCRKAVATASRRRLAVVWLTCTWLAGSECLVVRGMRAWSATTRIVACGFGVASRVCDQEKQQHQQQREQDDGQLLLGLLLRKQRLHLVLEDVHAGCRLIQPCDQPPRGKPNTGKVGGRGCVPYLCRANATNGATPSRRYRRPQQATAKVDRNWQPQPRRRHGAPESSSLSIAF